MYNILFQFPEKWLHKYVVTAIFRGTMKNMLIFNIMDKYLVINLCIISIYWNMFNRGIQLKVGDRGVMFHLLAKGKIAYLCRVENNGDVWKQKSWIKLSQQTEYPAESHHWLKKQNCAYTSARNVKT